MTIGPLMAFGSVYYPALSVLAAVFLVIGLKGVLMDIL